MPAVAAAPGHPSAPEAKAPWLADDPWLAQDPWWTEDPEPPPAAWLTEDPWLADEPGLGPSWLVEAPQEPDAQRPGPVEVLKAGRWDRSHGDGGGFAAGGVGDRLAPGPVLAGLAGDRWQAGLGRLSDDELIGVLRAARRLASWAAAMELATVGDLWRRRTAEEDAGDTGAAEFADDEIAAALTLTRHAANQVLDLAVALGRLPLSAAALAAGDIDLSRAKVIADAVTGLAAGHAAAVDRAVAAAAPGQTTGQLRAAALRAVLAADPAAARRRKEEAQREARVERWAEPAGTAALAGRDLPPVQVLAADANLTALATQLKAAGADGTMDALRAQIYLALLTGAPVTSLLPSAGGGSSLTSAPRPADRGHTSSGPADRDGGGCDGGGRGGDGGGCDGGGRGGDGGGCDGGGRGGDGGGCDGGGRGGDGGGCDGGGRGGDGGGCDGGGRGGDSRGGGSRNGGERDGGGAGLGGNPDGCTGLGSVAGNVNLTMPLATWLGVADTPGHAAGFGPLDAADCRILAEALAAGAGTQWCLTVTGPDGRPVAHGCARAGPSPGRRRSQRAAGARDRPVSGPQDRPASGPGDRPGNRDRPAAGPRDGPGNRDRPAAGSRDGPGNRDRDLAWTFTITRLGQGECDHAWETAAYKPSPGLRHLVRIRHVTCTFPGCRRPAARCDADHTLAYDRGGRTCLCNLAPLCRRHHQVKQARGWALRQTSPGVLTWTTPAGRRYTTTPTSYPA